MTVLGVDISNNQGTAVNFAACRAAGARFLFAKASEGTGYRDPYLARNLAGARAQGMVVGAYHFLRGGHGVAEANHFIRCVKAANGGTLKGVALIVDVEKDCSYADVRAFINRLSAYTHGRKIGVYTGAWYWEDPHGSIRGARMIGDYLWHSRYPDYTPHSLASAAARVGSSWWAQKVGGRTPDIIQMTSVATIGSLRLDGSLYRGSLDELQVLIGLKAKPSKKKPAATPKKVPQVNVAHPKFPLPAGAYFGPYISARHAKKAPARSVSGRWGHGNDLGQWQAQMKARGYKIKVTRVYDAATKRTAKRFQKNLGWAQTGRIGSGLWKLAWTAKKGYRA